MPNRNLDFRSNLSPLTKIWNREYAVRRLSTELAIARQKPGYQFSILLVQFDGFRMAGQDRLGFAAGSDMAPRVFAVLTEGLRENEVCCHLADDEFLLILPQRDETDCRALAGLLKFRWSPEPDSRESAVTLRAGWASATGGESTIERLFATADKSLARAWAEDGRGGLSDITSLEITGTRPAASERSQVGQS